jgi:hypothetical protein
MKPYRVTIWRWNPNIRSWTPCEKRRANTFRSAEKQANSTMGKRYETEHSQHFGKPPFATIDHKRHKQENINQEVVIVPSCGDRGFW